MKDTEAELHSTAPSIRFYRPASHHTNNTHSLASHTVQGRVVTLGNATSYKQAGQVACRSAPRLGNFSHAPHRLGARRAIKSIRLTQRETPPTQVDLDEKGKKRPIASHPVHPTNRD